MGVTEEIISLLAGTSKRHKDSQRPLFVDNAGAGSVAKFTSAGNMILFKTAEEFEFSGFCWCRKLASVSAGRPRELLRSS